MKPKIKNKLVLVWSGCVFLSALFINWLGLLFIQDGFYNSAILCIIAVVLLKIYGVMILGIPKKIKENFLENA